jgi:hypothetical protein
VPQLLVLNQTIHSVHPEAVNTSVQPETHHILYGDNDLQFLQRYYTNVS